ncbi:MAG: deoxyhypusine synthase [Isosphaeraceae bacterium]|nr:deoxyhypusine synthase [Isosphaeraceae bacterium]
MPEGAQPDYLRQISQHRISPPPVSGSDLAADLIDRAFLSYNAGRLREVCQVFVQKMLEPDCTVGFTLSGALTPAGLGMSCLIPLIRAGFVDWIISTGANLYHDTHYALDLPLHQSRPNLDDFALREHDIIRIYDIVFDYKTLLDTDAFYRTLIQDEVFARPMGTAEFHYEVGRYLHERAARLGGKPDHSLLAAAYEAGVPIYTSSPGDSSIGMNLAAARLAGGRLQLDPLRDVNETAALVYQAKHAGGKSGVLILGGGSPKNFILQTEPQIQEVLGLEESGHDYFLQITDARPDTGGLSGATAHEAMTWGKVDPTKLPDTVICYTDSTLALPLLTAYALARHAPRPLKRLYDRREAAYEAMKTAYLEREARGEPTGLAARKKDGSHRVPSNPDTLDRDR